LPAVRTVVAHFIRKVPLDWTETLPLLWMAFALLASFFAPDVYGTHLLWPAFAIWAAQRLETMRRVNFLKATGAIIIVCLIALSFTTRLREVLSFICPEKAAVFHGIPAYLWPAVVPVAVMALLAFTLFAGTAFWLEYRNRRRFAVLALVGGLIPAGYAFADADAKFAPYFSYADFAHSINTTRSEGAKVFVDGNRLSGSSLLFYLNLPYSPVAVAAPLKATGEPNPDNRLLEDYANPAKEVFLITRRERLPHWQNTLPSPQRVSFESGGSVLLSNLKEGEGAR
jgi:hypothetical protein